ncbi:MAG: DUF4276 family protein [Bacteroidales bacterium]|nr:DUF4276 family protein [Bacteroidales bacterium]
MKTLFIEGTSDTDNGDIRRAFRLLLEKELKGNMPRIFMGDGKKHTIDEFYTTPLQKGEKRFMLFDSDIPSPNKQEICSTSNKSFKKRLVDATTDNTFLMIQEVEAWILSQPDVLTAAGIDMSKFNCQNVETIHKPCEKLAELYKKSGKTYTKVNEFAKIFPKLDTTKLKQTSSEFKALIDALNK